MVGEHLLALVDRLAAAAPVVLVLDDIHWADEATLGLWLRMARSVNQLPLLLVATVRPVPRRSEMDALRRGLIDARAHLCQLGPLSPQSVAEMVTGIVGAAPSPGLDRQLQQAGGNPLYVLEIIDALTHQDRIKTDAGVADLVGSPTDVPVTLSAALARRLAFLSTPATSVLRVASLLGTAFTVDDLSVVTEMAATALIGVVDEALAAGILAESGNRLAFRHGLIRHSLYEAMPGSMRAALHTQAARALSAAGAPLERVAEQILAAPDQSDPWIVDWVVGAASALTYRSPLTAVEVLYRIRACMDPIDERRERLDTDLATALLQLGENEEAVTVLRPLLAARDPQIVGRATSIFLTASINLARRFEGVEAADRTLAMPELPAVWAARLGAKQATALAVIPDRAEEARSLALRAESDGRRIGDRVAVGNALHALSWTEYERDLVAHLAFVDQALAELGDEPEATDLRLTLLGNRAAGHDSLGRPDEADDAVARALVIAEQAGAPPRLASLRLMAAEIGFHRGQWDQALAELQAAGELSLNPADRSSLHGVSALIAVHRDDRMTVDRHLVDLDDLTSTDSRVRNQAQFLGTAWAFTAERDGQSSLALTRLLMIYDPKRTLEFTELYPGSCYGLPDVVRLAKAVGRRNVAVAAAKACLDDAQMQAMPAAAAAAEHCQGLIKAEPAQLHFAADTFHEIRYPLYQARALEDAAVIHAEHGNLRSARGSYQQAADIYVTLDANWDFARAASRLRPFGIRRATRNHRPTSGWSALTPTELKVADLVAEGRSNPEIAGELFISRRTVQTHVARILTKLDAHSRIAIARHRPTMA
jgi:DNA-binding CsgD family transcriptional regulator/tetratricopeptide (TPR) repeat protein